MKNLLSILKMDFVKTNRNGKNFHFFSCFVCCLIMVFGSLFQSLAAIPSGSNAFLVNPDYLIASGSNAELMTLDLGDDDYGIAPTSSLGTVTNTIGSSGVHVLAYYYDNNGTSFSKYVDVEYRNGRFYFSASVPNTYYFYRFEIFIPKADLPAPGTYKFSFDMASDFSYDVLSFFVWTQKTYKNASPVSNSFNPPFDYFSGDVYVSNYMVELTGVRCFDPFIHIKDANQLKIRNLGGSFAVNFTPANGQGTPTAGADLSDYDDPADSSETLSGISSSLESAAENLQYISTSQNLIIQGIDNVIMHISDQLYAFWDQLYNLIHEPTYARLGDILDAIRNLDLEITVEMTEVTNAVNKMNQEVQNKLQQTTDKITGGFDNSGINQDAAALDSSLQEYEQAEKNVLDNVNDSLNDFEFDSGLDEYKTSVQVFSDFLQALYESSGAFKIVINLSLMLSVAGIVIGLYRFKDGG